MSTNASHLNQSNANGAQENTEAKMITVPEPFNLTKTKPKMIPLP